MLKKILLLFLCLTLCFAVGCKKNEESLSLDRIEESSVPMPSAPEPEYSINPLTGLKNLEPGKETLRPVAITINNISVAQPVQTGLSKADIIYETEVEGGITRLVAVFQDTTVVDKIGTVRSARYPFIDIALGHNAIYVHHGQDPHHAAPHLKDVDRIVLSTNNAGVRISNGLASEHTLYAYGSNLWNAIKKQGINTVNSNPTPWQTFAAEETAVTLPTAASSVKVSFSPTYNTTLQYNAATGKYTRLFNGTQRNDYYTKEATQVKNVFVLKTTIRTYPNCPDNKHKEVMLNSGDGYYLVNGTYTPIKWSKGASTNSFVFTNADGSALTVNAGNSWVCIADKGSAITIQ